MSNLEGYSLSPQQLETWHNLRRGYTRNVQAVVSVGGKVDQQQLAAAVGKALEGSSVYRLSFREVAGLKDPVQVVENESKINFDFFAISAAEQADEIAKDKLDISLDPSTGPLLVVTLCVDPQKESTIIFTSSSLCADGWSIALLAQRVVAALAGEEVAEPALDYLQYSEWQNQLLESEDIEEGKAHWKDKLSGQAGNPHLLFERNNQSGKAVVGFLQTRLDEALAKLLLDAASQEAVLAASWYLLLWKLNKGSGFTLGHANHGRSFEQLYHIPGNFSKLLPLNVDLNDGQPLAGFVQQYQLELDVADTHKEALKIDENYHRYASRNLAYQFEYIDHSLYGAGANLQSLILPDRQLKAKLHVSKLGENFTAAIYYDTISFDATDIYYLFNAWAAIAKDIIKNQHQKTLKNVELLNDEYRKVVEAFSYSGFVELEPLSVTALFSRQVAANADRTAVADEKQTFTYEELDKKSASLAKYLVSKGHLPGHGRVGILHTENAWMLLSMLAVLKAGGTYIPMDPRDSKKRLQHILRDSAIECVLTESGLEEVLAGHENILPLPLDVLEYEDAALRSLQLPERSPETPCYIIYTSGTSGLPKGVVIKDSSLVNYVSWLKTNFELSAADSSMLLSSYAFDLGYTALWGMLLCGGAIHILSRELVQDMDFLADYIAEKNISFIKTTPSFFQVLVRSANAKKLSNPALRWILLGGEIINADDLSYLHNSINQTVKVVNHYGPTETTIGTIAYPIDLDKLDLYKQHPVIGRPITNNQVFILDEEGNLAAPGTAGEICIAGKGLAQGYLHRDDLTADKFKEHKQLSKTLYHTGDLGAWMPDGTILFFGRKDDQVKIRGYRVEPGEVKLAISQYPGVEQVVVAVKDNSNYNKELVAYVTAKTAIDAEGLKTFLKDSVPDYMIPAHIVQVKEIPLTANHKTDYKALPDPASVKSAFKAVVPPRHAKDESILRIWKEILGKTEMGIDDNFFDLGGHSLKAIQMVNRLHKELHIKTSLKEIFAHPTVRALSDATKDTAQQQFHQIEVVPVKEYYELSNAQKRIWLTSQRKNSRTIYNVPQQALFKGELNATFLENAFVQLVARHESLRTLFKNVNGEAVQKILSPSEVNFRLEHIEVGSTAEIDELITREVEEPFDIENEIGLRGKLVKLGDNEHLLLFTLHHIISDGWSRAIIYKELLHFYEAAYHNRKISLPALRIQYKDYVSWHNKQYNEQEPYWAELFRQGMPVNNFPLDHPRPKKQSFDGAVSFLKIDEQGLQKLQQVVNANKLTLNSLFMAAYGFLLGEYCNQREVVAGTIVSGRGHTDLEGLIGVFINYLPVKIEINKEHSFIEYSSQLGKNLINVYQHQDYPFDLMVEKFFDKAESSRNPVFDTMLIFHESEDSKYSKELPGGVSVEEYYEQSGTNTSKLDFKVDVITKDNEIGVRLEYNRNLFTAGTIELFLERFNQLLNTIAENPNTLLKDINLVPQQEQSVLEQKRRNQLPVEVPELKIMASFTAEPLQDYLEWWLSQFKLPYELSFGGYHQVFQELMNADQSNGSKEQVCVVLNRFEDYVKENQEGLFESLDLVYAELVKNVRSLALTKPIIVVLLPLDEQQHKTHVIDYVAHLNNKCFNELKEVQNVYLADLRKAAETYPSVNVFDAVSYKSARIPFTEDFFYLLGYHINRVVWGLKGTPCKVIALDCDNTLWEGVCGEDNINEIKIREGHRELQQYFIQKSKEGFLLVLVSKNNEKDVWNIFEQHPGMLLKKEHFVGWKIDWNPKPGNLRTLAKELNLGLDSFAFIDDNPVECQQMMRENPEVLSLELPAEHYHFRSFLDHVIAFDKLRLSKEDAARTEMYQAEKQREAYRGKTGMDEFLQSLNLELSFKRVSPEEIERASQLSKRTNQFNLNGIRYSTQEIEQFICTKNFDCFAVHVRDRFGDYGFVGLVIAETRETQMLLHGFMLSCRVLGRGVEQAIMSVLRNLCEQKGSEIIGARYIETSKNIPFREFLNNNNWKAGETAPFQIAVTNIAESKYITIYFDKELPVKEAPATVKKETALQFDFDHVGVAVKSIGQAKPFFDKLGFTWSTTVHDELQHARLTMASHQSYFNVELVEGAGKQSPITNILNSREALPYHICFRVQDHQSALKFLQENNFNYEMISEPRPAVLFNNLPVLFIYQKELGLIELIEDKHMDIRSGSKRSSMPVLQVVSHDVDRAVHFYKLFGFLPVSEYAQSGATLRNDRAGQVEILAAASLQPANDADVKRAGAHKLVLDTRFFSEENLEGEVAGYVAFRNNESASKPAWIWRKNLCNEENLFHDKVYKALEFCSLHNMEKIRREGVSRRSAKAAYEAPATELEQMLVNIFQEVLRIDKIGANDDFFELGGHSLKATQVLTRVYKNWQVEIPLTTFFDNSSVKMLAACIEKQQETDAWLEASETGGDDQYDEIIL
jgi:amino acid adenylation domain-containing protein/FkbH-like protein